MIEATSPAHSTREGGEAKLLMNGKEVGCVAVRGRKGSWMCGDFRPTAGFSEFAPVFGRWSLLIHAMHAGERLSEAASEELRATEYEMDAIHASLVLSDNQEPHPLRQVNIDGSLIEWKE